MGVNGAHNTIGKMSAPTTLFVREAAEYCFMQGMVPSIVV